MVGTLIPPRLGTCRNHLRPTLGNFVDHVAGNMGFDFHEWQKLLSDVSMEIIPRANVSPGVSTQRLNAQYVGCMVGRQSGKTAWSASRTVAQCALPNYPAIAESFGLDKIRPQHVAYTAQSRTNAVARWMEHVSIMEASPYAMDLISVVRYATGREVVEFKNGSTYRPVTPNRNNSRGMSLDLVIVDEALAHPMWLLGVLRPTMAQRDGAQGSIGAQFVVISNAGDDDSELLNRMQELGIESLTDPNARRVWLEWSATADDDVYNEDVWARTMPTLGQPNGIDHEFVRMEAETLREDQFAREYLCRRSIATADQIIPTELWAQCYRTDVFVPMDRIVLGLDVRFDRMGASLVSCGPVDAYLPLEVVDCRSGLDWVLERTIEVARRWSAPVVVDGTGPAANLILSLEANGCTVVKLDRNTVCNAAASFYDNVFAKRVVHLNDYKLNDAIMGASRRAVGDRWAFDRRGQWDISPLIAASFAAWVVDSESSGRPTIY